MDSYFTGFYDINYPKTGARTFLFRWCRSEQHRSRLCNVPANVSQWRRIKRRKITEPDDRPLYDVKNQVGDLRGKDAPEDFDWDGVGQRIRQKGRWHWFTFIWRILQTQYFGPNREIIELIMKQTLNIGNDKNVLFKDWYFSMIVDTFKTIEPGLCSVKWRSKK